MAYARVLVCLGLVVLLACHEADSVIVVSVTAESGIPPVTQLRTTMSNRGIADVKLYPQSLNSKPISFTAPATFAIILPSSRSGNLDLVVEGLDATMKVVATGAGRAVIIPGKRGDVSVALTAGVSLCGNGRTDPGEQCDDGNRTSGDGCDYQCQAEPQSDAGTGDRPGIDGNSGTGGMGTGGTNTGGSGKPNDAGASGGVGGRGLGPFVRSSTWAYGAERPSVTCALNSVAAGDVLFAVVHSSGFPGVSIGASDSEGDLFLYAQDWGVSIGTGAAVARTTGNGTVDITISVGNNTAGLSLFCYDLVGVDPQVSSSTGVGSGIAFSVSPALTIQANSIVVALWAMYGSPANLIAGSGFAITAGSPISGQANNYISSEYRIASSTSTDCPMMMSVSQDWGGMCFALPPSP